MNKRSGLILLLLLSVSLAHAAAPDEDFGRLFSSASERKKLDIQRQNRKLPVTTPQSAPQSVSGAVELPQAVTLQGYVKRSDGAATLWVNNQPVQENSTLDEVEIGRLAGQNNSAKSGADSVNVRIPATGKSIRLKAGQVYDPETNQIVELKLLEKEKQLTLEQTGVIDDSSIDQN